MSQLLSSPTDCCRPCSEPLVTNIPGVPGATGATGANGTNGVNAFTVTTVPFTMPAEGANVVVTVEDTTWMAIEQILVVSVGGVFGWFEVVSKPTTTTVELKNLKSTATDEYMDNSAPGTVFANGAEVSPGGLQGPAGVDGTGGAPTTAKYLVQTPVGGGVLPNEVPLSLVATGLLHNTNGTGALSAKTLGIADANVAPVSQVAGMTAGQAVFAVAAGIESKSATDAKTALGIGTIASQAANSVAITGGSIAGTTISGSTGSFTTLSASSDTTLQGKVALSPSALQTVAAANLITSTAPKVRVAGNGGPVVMTSTPTIGLGTLDGQMLLVQGTHDTNTVELQDNGSLAGSKLRLGAANRILGAGDSVLLSWDATLGFWCEVAFTNLV